MWFNSFLICCRLNPHKETKYKSFLLYVARAWISFWDMCMYSNYCVSPIITVLAFLMLHHCEFNKYPSMESEYIIFLNIFIHLNRTFKSSSQCVKMFHLHRRVLFKRKVITKVFMREKHLNIIIIIIIIIIVTVTLEAPCFVHLALVL